MTKKKKKNPHQKRKIHNQNTSSLCRHSLGKGGRKKGSGHDLAHGPRKGKKRALGVKSERKLIPFLFRYPFPWLNEERTGKRLASHKKTASQSVTGQKGCCVADIQAKKRELSSGRFTPMNWKDQEP